MLRATQAWATTYRRTWRTSVFSTVVTPALYLAAMGLGLGSLINNAHRGSLSGITYLDFLAPGLLAAAAMQTAAAESTWPVLASVKWIGTYKAMLAAPLEVRDIAFGHLLWIAARITLTATVFAVVIVLFGAAPTAGIALAVPAAVLTGMAFAAPIAAFSVGLERDLALASFMRFVIMPLFLFSGTFFPVTQLPPAIRWIAYITPLWNGVALCRSLSLGTATAVGVAAHVTYLERVRHHRVGRRRRALPQAAGHMSSPGTSRALAWRAIPPAVLGTRRASRLIERSLLVYRHTWLIIVSGFFEPVFYLLSIQIGIGHLVGTVQYAGQTVSYVQFAAPALLASSAMNGAIYESTMNVFFKLRYDKLYDAVLATPVGPNDVALGEIGFCLLRGALYAMAFLAVMLVMGLLQSLWAVLLLPAAVLVGFAFAAAGMACTTYMRSWTDFELVQMVILPMFLLSATFYPLSTYPPALRVVVAVTPLYQAVALMRALALGTVSPASLLHAAYLAVMGAVGLVVAGRRIGQLLLS